MEENSNKKAFIASGVLLMMVGKPLPVSSDFRSKL